MRISGPQDRPTEPGLRRAGGSSVEVISGPASVIPKVWITGTPNRVSISAISCGARAAATERIRRSELGRGRTGCLPAWNTNSFSAVGTPWNQVGCLASSSR